jgi:protein QN1
LQFFTVMQEMLQYEVLQEKLSELEHRHETREQKLQAIVRDLLRRNAEQRVVTGGDRSAATMKEKLLDKNRQLCLYRAEMDRILETLREFSRHQKSGSTVQLAPD